MNTLKSLIAFTILLSSNTVHANDYALTHSYPLLNDMKMVEKEQLVLNDMNIAISNHKTNSKDKLIKLKNEFSTVIDGLSNGNKTFNLHGTKLVVLKNEIKKIQLIWSQEKSILDSALNNKLYEKEAKSTIKKLSKKLIKLNRLYKKSYIRYKKNSTMKSLVKSYMKKNTKQIYALK
jgi:hypothetical protein